MVKKEITIAIVIGLIIGLIITGGVLRARSAIKNISSPDSKSRRTTSLTDNDKSKNQLSLSISEPEDNSIVQEATITLTGQTIPDTYVAIVAEKSEHLIVPNDVGQFTQDIDLIKGANTIKITVYTNNGDKTEKILNIVYTTAEI